jgi:hypothetical protein
MTETYISPELSPEEVELATWARTELAGMETRSQQNRALFARARQKGLSWYSYESVTDALSDILVPYTVDELVRRLVRKMDKYGIEADGVSMWVTLRRCETRGEQEECLSRFVSRYCDCPSEKAAVLPSLVSLLATDGALLKTGAESPDLWVAAYERARDMARARMESPGYDPEHIASDARIARTFKFKGAACK